VRYYFKNLVYHFLEFISNTVNFLSAILGVYPQLDLGVWFLCELEVRRIAKDSGEHLKEKKSQLDKADALKEEAVRTLDGGS
jgi:hypothetical protein